MRAAEVLSGDSDVRRKLFEDGKSVSVICILIENNWNKIIDRDKPLVGEKYCVTTLITAAKERYFYQENIMEFWTVISVAFPATKLFDKCRVSHV